MKNLLPADASELIPHRAGMCLINSLVEYGEEDSVAVTKIENSNLFRSANGQLNSIVFIELLAQTAAAHSGYKAQFLNGAKKFGFLVGVKDLEIYRTVAIGETLRLVLHRDYQMENLTYLNGKVMLGETLVAQGVLKIWEMAANDVQTITEVPDSQKKCSDLFVDINSRQKAILDSEYLNGQISGNLLNFKVLDEITAKAEFCFGSDFIGFEGHFPNNPILPGVMLLKTGQFLVDLISGRPQLIKIIKTAKFAKTVLPGETISFALSKKENQWRIQVKGKEGLCAKFSFEMINN